MSAPMTSASESTSTLASSAPSSTETMVDNADAPLPPTSNNLNREERMRLLRSTRKLEALLGATPVLIDSEMAENDDFVAPLASPRTKTRRREGRIFPDRASSPNPSVSSEEDYVLVQQGVQSSAYPNNFSPEVDAASTSAAARTSNLSVNTTASRKRKARGPIPAALVFDVPRSGSGFGAGLRSGSGQANGASVSKKANAGMKPSNRTQPQPSLFLRLRPAFARNIKTKAEQAPVPANSPYIHLPPQVPNPPTPGASQTRLPLSPSMATFANPNLSTASFASSHYSFTPGKGAAGSDYFDLEKSSKQVDDLDYMDTTPDGRRVMTDRDRRRKMAKLARTLGENVPPELVFRPPPPARRTSGSYASNHFGLYNYPKPPPPPPVIPGLPKLAVADVPPPPPQAVAHAPTAAPSPPVIASTSSSGSKASKKSRPRSLTMMSPSNSTDTTRGTTSMDAPASPAMAQGGHRATKSLGRTKSVKGAAAAGTPEKPFAEHSDSSRSASRMGGDEGQFGRRKEREWSGEWNLKDMNDVAARLRGLKA